MGHALNQVRRQAWNDARKLGRTEPKPTVGRPLGRMCGDIIHLGPRLRR